ncbi:MAG TPA: hypothetical protein VFZ24_12030 [Longimicrobiales bacterium]
MRRRISGQFVAASSGLAVSLRSGRGPRIIIVAHGVDCAECAAYAARLAGEEDALNEWGARVTVVAPDGERAIAAPLAASGVEVLLSRDPAGTFGIAPAALVVTDEWGEVYFSIRAGSGHEFPDPGEVIDWIRFVAIQCPECEQPEGEWRSLP